MNRRAFQHLLRRYLDGTSSAEEKKLVEQWYQLLDDDIEPVISDQEIKQIEQRLWTAIQSNTHNDAAVIKVRGQNNKRLIVLRWVAAAIVVIVAGTLLYNSGNNNKQKVLAQLASGKKMLEITNQTSLNDTIWLEDSSRIILYPGAILTYPSSFSDKREVYLEGGAFFDVAKKNGQPFFVYNQYIITQVLGTSFSITNQTNAQTEVSVRSGRVAVYEHHDGQLIEKPGAKKNGVILTPNQKTTFYSKEKQFVTGLVESPQPLSINADSQPSRKFVYDDTPLSVVMQHLQDVYGIEFMVDNEALYNCPFTGDLTQQPLFNKLEMICTSIQASFEIEGTKILVHGKGCN